MFALPMLGIKNYAILGLVIALLSFSAYHSVVASSLREDIEAEQAKIGELRVQTASLRSQKDNLEIAIAEQNASIEAMEAATLKASADAQKAIDEVSLNARVWQERYAYILNQPRPEGATECEATEKLMSDYIYLRVRESNQ